MLEKKKDVRTRQTKKLIIDTMFKLLEKKDFDDITINDICNHAAISRTTFYFHFDDKFDLLLKCIGEINYYFTENLQNGIITKETIIALIETVFEKRRSLQSLLRYSGTWELKHRLDQMFINIYVEYFNKMAEQGIHFNVPIKLVAIYNSFGFSTVMNWVIEHSSPLEVHEIADYLYRQTKQIEEFYTKIAVSDM